MLSRQDLENLGHKVRGTYRGPLDWSLCLSLCNSLQQGKNDEGDHIFPLGALRIVQQEGGFNIVEVLT